MAKFYYAKPTRVQAFQWTGAGHVDYPVWYAQLIRVGAVAIRTVGGVERMRIARGNTTPLHAVPGDYIVNRDDTLFVLKPITFDKLYAPLPETVPQYDTAMG